MRPNLIINQIRDGGDVFMYAVGFLWIRDVFVGSHYWIVTRGLEVKGLMVAALMLIIFLTGLILTARGVL